MKKGILVLAAVLALCNVSLTPSTASSDKPLPPAPTPNTTLTPPANSDEFTFVVSGDNRSTGHGYPMPPSLARICEEIGIVRPAFTLWTGDAIEGYGDTPTEANAEYDVLFNAFTLTGAPVYNAPGNHEFSLDPSLLPVYTKRMGPLYGSFDYANSHFVALNTTPVSADGNIGAGGTIDDAQFTWLQQDLEANKQAKNTFVFMHHYMFGPTEEESATPGTGFTNMADRDRLHKLFIQFGVRAVFMGHNHIYWHAVQDGIDYYISGGAGAPLDASPEHGGYYHYIVMNVEGAKATPQILEPWHLSVSYPNGDGKAKSSETAWVENTNYLELKVNAVPFHVLAPAAGQTLGVKAVINYKGKTKPATAQIVSVKPMKDRRMVEVLVQATLKKARTTEIVVAPTPIVAKS